MKKVNIAPGVHHSILAALTFRAQAITTSEKLYDVIFDDMVIKEKLQYDGARDTIDGTENVGDMGKSQYVANHAGVFMVRRLVGNWKQPVGYFLTSGPMSSWSWKTVFLNVETNCKWLACWWWCDQGSNNRSMMTELGISVTDLTFEVNNEKLHALFDPPHKYQVQL